jgi:Phage tail sheath protein beta-sandwich domain
LAGTFSTTSLPKRAGAYFNFIARPQVLVPPAVGSVVAVPFVHTWGPDATVVALSDFSDFTAVYGNDLASQGYRAVRQAFRGEAARGRRGAGTVLAYRMAAASAAKATVSLTNVTPAAALRVDAIYKGTRGNNLRVTIQTDPIDGTKRDFIVLDGATEIERFVYTPTSMADLASRVNGVSDWVTVTTLIDGVALTAVASVPLTGGADGTTLTAGEWTAMMTAFEPQRFGYFAPHDLTDVSITASVVSWGKNANAKGRRFFVVLGGVLDEAVSVAVTRASTMNDPDFITMGVGSIRDNEMLDANGNPIVLSTSQFAPRLAGIMSALGENRSLTGARVAGVDILNGANEASIDSAFAGGVIVLARDSDAEAPVRVEKGLSTYTTTTNQDVPYLIFRNPKFVRTLHDLQDEITQWVQSEVIGQLSVNAKSRSAVVAHMSTLLQSAEDGEAIQPGWTAQVSANPPPIDSAEYIAIDVGLAFERSAEQVLTTITVA